VETFGDKRYEHQCVILCSTNKKANYYNQIIKSKLFPDSNYRFSPGETFMFTEYYNGCEKPPDTENEDTITPFDTENKHTIISFYTQNKGTIISVSREHLYIDYLQMKFWVLKYIFYSSKTKNKTEYIMYEIIERQQKKFADELKEKKTEIISFVNEYKKMNKVSENIQKKLQKTKKRIKKIKQIYKKKHLRCPNVIIVYEGELIEKYKQITEYVKNMRNKIDMFWKEYYDIKLKYLPPITDCYAMTIYKSQGSSYEHCFIDLQNVFGFRDSDWGGNVCIFSRALYTSITRTSETLCMYYDNQLYTDTPDREIMCKICRCWKRTELFQNSICKQCI
jgi:hypothetical protein